MILNFWFLLSLDSIGYATTIVTAFVVAIRYLSDAVFPLILGNAVAEELGPSLVGALVSAASGWLILVEVLAYIVILSLLFLHVWYFVRRKDLFYRYHTEELRRALKEDRSEKAKKTMNGVKSS